MHIPYSVTARPDTGINNTRLGVWLFLASEAMLFGGLISAYAFLRTGSASGEFGQHLSDVPLAGFNTLILLASSVVVTLSLWAFRAQSFKRSRTFLGLTVLLGIVFLLIKALDYSHKFSEGLYPSSSTYLAIFYTLTGVHALHVVGGGLVNSYNWLTMRNLERIDPGRLASRISAAALYWNFVDAVWIVLFLLLYVM